MYGGLQSLPHLRVYRLGSLFYFRSLYQSNLISSKADPYPDGFYFFQLAALADVKPARWNVDVLRFNPELDSLPLTEPFDGAVKQMMSEFCFDDRDERVRPN